MDYKKIKGLVEKLGELEMSCYKDCRDARKTLQEIKLEAQSLRDFINDIAKNKTYVEKTKKVEEKPLERFEAAGEDEEEIEEQVLEKNEDDDELYLAK